MDMQLLGALAVGCSASLTLNIGKGIQKLKVVVLKQGKKVLTRPHRRDFIIWLIGVLMTAVAGVLFMKALDMTDKSSIVSSLNGIGMVGLAIFSLVVLKERVGPREIAAVSIIIIGTGLVQYFNVSSGEGQTFTTKALALSAGLCAAAFAAPLALAQITKKGRAFVYAAIAGAFLGFMVTLFDIAGVAGGGGLVGMVKTPYFFIGFLCGNMAFIMTNVAFFHGSGIVIVPTVNSFMIVMPVILEIFIFRVLLRPMQYAGIALIVLGVVVLTTAKGHGVEAEAKRRSS